MKYEDHQRRRRDCASLDRTPGTDHVTCLHKDNPTQIKVCSAEHCPRDNPHFISYGHWDILLHENTDDGEKDAGFYRLWRTVGHQGPIHSTSPATCVAILWKAGHTLEHCLSYYPNVNIEALNEYSRLELKTIRANIREEQTEVLKAAIKAAVSNHERNTSQVVAAVEYNMNLTNQDRTGSSYRPGRTPPRVDIAYVSPETQILLEIHKK